MLTKRQFLALYDDTVLTIRQIKNNNDKINKSIGVLSESSLHKQTQSEKQMVQNLFEKVDQLIQKMQKNYLDPDTARKIGVVKQQLRIQKDRRAQLIENVDQITKQFKQKLKLTQKQQQLVYNSPKSKRGSATNSSIQMQAGDNYSILKRSQLTDIDNQTNETDHHSSQIRAEMGDCDYEMERKLLQDRNQKLSYAHEKIISIKNIYQQTENLVYQQGNKLDMIGDDLFTSYKNMDLANGELDEANQNHKKSRKKYIVLSLLVLLIVTGVIVFAFVM